MSRNQLIVLLSTIAIATLACNLPSSTKTIPVETPSSVPTPLSTEEEANFTTPILPTNTPTIIHIMTPSTSPAAGAIVYDVQSKDTAPENRAPYGDSYNINLLERPFKQDMTYVSDMDIVTYNLSQDADWYYVSIELISGNPNNSIGINYGVEIDSDVDGFGDLLIWAEPPYASEWSNANLRVYKDDNHDTGGISAERSDAPLERDGYETLHFERGLGDDPDLAWVRSNAGLRATIQFAFKKSLTNGRFMLGVISDAGLQDVTRLDYNDHFTASEAGSPVRSNKNYPLGELYLVDNSCREAFGFTPTGYEPHLCPRPETPKKEPGQQGGTTTTTVSCKFPLSHSDAASCQAAGCVWKQTSSIPVIEYCGRP